MWNSDWVSEYGSEGGKEWVNELFYYTRGNKRIKIKINKKSEANTTIPRITRESTHKYIYFLCDPQEIIMTIGK